MTSRKSSIFPWSGMARRAVRVLLGAALAGCGASTGGTSASGGASAGSGGQGAMTSGSGGAGSGGVSGSGGFATATGGARASSGGTSGSGGVSASGGGAPASGGASSGGTIGSGGTVGSGGAVGGGGRGAAGGTAGRPGATGGAATGGGSPSGGAPGAGGGSAFRASYFIGADITDQEPASDAARADLLSQMKAHGFNFIRLRTFVDPKAADGYDKTNGYDDITHTVAFGKTIKAAGMGLLVDFHYSDNWADPGKQCVPVAWQSLTTIADLAAAVHDYTKDAIMQLVAGGARPDMVQIGNETTPGMLLHRCDSGGQPTGNNPITGSTSNWTNLGMLLKAGVQGVKDVDPTILISLHIDRGGDKPTDSQGAALATSTTWITNAMKQGVVFDAFGESCYQRYQGDPSSTANTKTGWTNTFSGLATKFPALKFFAAEYGPMQREINDVVYGLAGQQGLGTFNWEPTTQGDWNTGHDLWRRSGNTYTAQPDVALYDQMKMDYASRL